MKKKNYFVLSLAVFGFIFLWSNQNVNAEGTDCMQRVDGYKKRFLVSGCKEKEGDICFVRCDQPNMPTISV